MPYLRLLCAKGWSRNCVNKSRSNCYSHFQGYTPTGQPTSDWFPHYPGRIPLLGALIYAYANANAKIISKYYSAILCIHSPIKGLACKTIQMAFNAPKDINSN